MDVNNNGGNNNNVKNPKNGRELFYVVIAVACFIIMAVGATFAYFTATASSANSAIGTGSTTLELQYISYNEAWSKSDLIPANTAVVEYSVEYQDDSTATGGNSYNTMCVDDYGNSICSVYQFKVINNSNSPQTVSLDVVSEVNGFSSLNAMAYDLTIEDDPDTDFNEVDYYNNTAIAKQKFEADGETPSVDETGKKQYEEESYVAEDPVFKTSSADSEDGSKIAITDGNGNNIYEENLDSSIYAPIYVNRKYAKKTLLKYNSDTSGGTNLDPAIDRLVVPVNNDNEFADADSRTVRVADNITVYGVDDPDGNVNYKNLMIVLYVRNSNIDQTSTDADKQFSGRVVVSNGAGGTGVSGTISAVGSNELQSGTENQPGTSN